MCNMFTQILVEVAIIACMFVIKFAARTLNLFKICGMKCLIIAISTN